VTSIGVPPLDGRVVVEAVHVQLVHPLEVEPERAALTMDLEAVRVLVARRQPGGLEAGERAAAEPGQEQHGVVDGAPPLRARGLCPRTADLPAGRSGHDVALLDEGVLDRALHRHDLLAGDEADQVDDVGVEVAVRP
jgi:hypothetical protein